MQIDPLKPKLQKYLTQKGLTQKFKKQSALFIANPKYPSLNTERLEPRELKIYSFRIDKKHRSIFIFKTPSTIEIIDINSHYQ
jgi:Txe/YoeB family toxin of Txe-Axe toxin-antitoxin module